MAKAKILTPQQVCLYGHLIERTCAEEWHRTLVVLPKGICGHTLVPYEPFKNRRPSGDSGFVQAADNEAIYWQICKRLPIAAYFWDNDVYLKMFVAVDFDFLAFASFYLNNAYRIAMEVYGLTTKSTGKDYRHSTTRNESQFSLSKNPKPSKEGVDQDRVLKTDLFEKAWQNAIKDLLQAVLVRNEMMKTNPMPTKCVHWQIIKSAPTMEDLHPSFKGALHSIIAAAAATSNNILENEERYRRAERLMRKVPEKFIVNSLYVVTNPAPFVSTAIGLFVKKIPGFGVSLFQLFGSSLVGYSRTKAQQKGLESRLPEKRQKEIKSIVIEAGPLMSVTTTPKEIKKILEKGKLENVSKEDIAYARFTTRLAEKQDFISYLGSGNIKFAFLAKILPTIMREFMKFQPLAEFAKSFFEMLRECLSAIGQNFDKKLSQSLSKEEISKKVVQDLSKAITKFVNLFYSALHKIANTVGTDKEPPVLVWLIDMFLNVVCEWSLLPFQMEQMYSRLDRHIQRMPQEQQEEIAAFSTQLMGIISNGFDERFWPRSSAVDHLALVAHDELKKVVLGMEIFDIVEQIHTNPLLQKYQI